MAENEQVRTEAPPAKFMREYGISGLDFTMGMVQADPKIELQGRMGAEQYELMRHEDPTVAAVLLALTLPIRQASWRVNPASDAPGDVRAAEFVEECMHDMSSGWDDVLAEACTMYPFGWAFLEWVLKKRAGREPGRGKASSKYSDGRIGWRKMALRAQTSLSAWDLDDKGGINGMIQEDPQGGKYLDIPLEKALLFRTTRERNNPEGFSVLRPAHRSWKFKHQLERIEAIGLQRALMGTPVIKMLSGYTRSEDEGEQSQETIAQNLLKGLYANTTLGVIEDPNMEFRFESPDMQGITGDSSRVIQRLDEGIARSSLAMYILLGSRERGSYALAKELSDLFFLAVEGYIGIIAQVFTRWAVPSLFQYNVFPGVVEYPEITTAINRRVDLEVIARFINDTVERQVLTPDDALEQHIRRLADFPPMSVEIVGRQREAITPEPEEEITPAPEQTSETEAGPGPVSDEQGGERVSRSSSAPFIGDIEHFIALAGEDRLSAYHAATNAYRDELRGDYAEWITVLPKQLGEATPQDMQAAQDKWREALLALLLLLKRRGWARFPQAMALGYGLDGLPPELRSILETEMEANDSWLETNLLPAIRSQMGTDLEQVMLLLWAGQDDDALILLEDILQGRLRHVALYAGHFWRAIWLGAIQRIKEADYSGPVRWVMDAFAEHCGDCRLFGDQTYTSIDDLLSVTGGILPGNGTACDGNCRCSLEYRAANSWIVI